MSASTDPDTPRVTDQLHPFVHTILACLILWLAVAGWLFFSHGGFVELDLAIISWFVLVVLAVVSALRLIRRIRLRSDAAESGTSVARDDGLRDWLSSTFATLTGQEKSWGASIEILLPMTAAAFGMTAIGIVFDLTMHGSRLL